VGPLHITPLIDQTLLRAEATVAAIDQLCAYSLRYGFAAVCVNPCYVSRCAERLAGSSLALATVIGFPLGACTSPTKKLAIEQALADGATELDIVMNIGMLKSGYVKEVGSELQMLCSVASDGGGTTKIIVETPLLTLEETIMACELVIGASADYVKTSTGLEGRIATLPAVRLLKSVVGSSIGIKAAGGIRTLDDARSFITAGATRIGTSAGVSIADEEATATFAGVS